MKILCELISRETRKRITSTELEANAAHEFICEVKFVGIPDWQKAGAA